MDAPSIVHELPTLPYAAGALDPYIDERTLTLHHGAHHAAYVKALNLALKATPEWQGKSAEWLMINWRKLPESIATSVRNNAGGHVNHSFLWRSMSPATGGAPSGALERALVQAFGSLEQFRARFEEAGSTLFGSGWVWLAVPRHGDAALQLTTTSGHENPLSHGMVPLLVNDVWEHAYYLQYQNRRAEYLARWWPVVNWHEAGRRFEAARDQDSAAVEGARAPRLDTVS